MLKFSIRAEWFISSQGGNPISLPPILGLLTEIDRSGNLVAACKTQKMSYRHGWGLLREFEENFKTPLLITSRRQGTQLTPFAQKLIWANKRIEARLAPTLESLASELEHEIGLALPKPKTPLKIHASHGFAIAALIKKLEQQDSIEIKYESSAEALASLNRGSCEVVGFHIPIGPLRATVIQQYLKYLNPQEHRLAHLAVRTQGIITAPGNPKNITSIRDFTRTDVSIVNRQLHSGTRTLLDLLIQDEKIDSAQIRGYENSEFTHAAVAAYIASGMADAGFGIETGARKFGLDFQPIATENYYIIFNTKSEADPALQSMLAIMKSDNFRDEINQIAGYVCQHPSEILKLQEELNL